MVRAADKLWLHPNVSWLIKGIDVRCGQQSESATVVCRVKTPGLLATCCENKTWFMFLALWCMSLECFLLPSNSPKPNCLRLQADWLLINLIQTKYTHCQCSKETLRIELYQRNAYPFVVLWICCIHTVLRISICWWRRQGVSVNSELHKKSAWSLVTERNVCLYSEVHTAPLLSCREITAQTGERKAHYVFSTLFYDSVYEWIPSWLHRGRLGTRETSERDKRSRLSSRDQQIH